MKKRNWTRFLCLTLAICLVAGVALSVNALYFVGDLSGDGKITAFDAQILAEAKAGKRTLSEAQQQIADMSSMNDLMSYIFGNTDIDGGNIDTNDTIEIYSADGLQLLRDKPTANYVLMNDIDLGGADWLPLSGFNGNLNGNGHTISNLNITEGAPSFISPNGTKFNMGFFGDLGTQAVVTGLHLRNVTVTATEDALYLGLLAGSVRGQISESTATGTIIDARQSHSTTTGSITFIGALAGRICTPDTGKEAGSVTGGTAVSVCDEQGKYTTEGLCADIKFVVADKANVNLVNGVHQKYRLVGWHPNTATVSGIWSDSSNSSDLLSASIQQRQDIAVDYMNTMGSVAWTPTETLVYRYNPTGEVNTSKTYYAGTTYYGLPYNHHNGSYERFLTAMDSQDENGVYITKTGLGDSIYTTNENGVGGYDGFVQIMGNDCSTSLAWAWMQISPVRVKPGANDNQASYAGGAAANRTRYLVPNDSNREAYGVYPIGDWVTSDYNEATGQWTIVEYDPSLAAYDISTERSSEDILLAVGEQGMMELYAQTHKADGLVRHRADLIVDENGNPVLNSSGNQTYDHFGHCRMVVADPVVIRNADGSIDGDMSYLLTTEQGSSTGSTSTWKVNYKRSFTETMFYDADNPYTGKGPYLPMTIRALKDEAVKPAYLTQYPDQHLAGPVNGKIYSNYRFNSVTVTVTDTTGTVYYDNEIFTGINFADSSTRSVFSTIDLSSLHGEAFAAAAAESGMIEGTTYYYTVTALLSDGTVANLNQRFLKEDRSAFTYTAE